MNTNPKNLRVFIKLDKRGNVVLGSAVRRASKPKKGNWLEIPSNVCCNKLEEDTPPEEDNEVQDPEEGNEDNGDE